MGTEWTPVGDCGDSPGKRGQGFGLGWQQVEVVEILKSQGIDELDVRENE